MTTMKLLKRLALPLLAVSALSLTFGCGKPLSSGEGVEGQNPRDSAAMARKHAREEADRTLRAAYLKCGQALSLAHLAVQAKLEGNASLAGPAAPTAAPETQAPAPGVPSASEAPAEAPAAAPVEGEAPPEAAPAEGEAPAEGTAEMPAEQETVQAETGPVVPVALPQGTLANELCAQAYALLVEVETETAGLLAGPFAQEPRVKTLAQLIETLRNLVYLGAAMEPVQADVLALMQPAETVEEAPAAEAAPAEGEAPAAEAAPVEGEVPAAPAEGEVPSGESAEAPPAEETSSH